VLGECSEDEDSFHYSIRGSATKVDDLGVEFLHQMKKIDATGKMSYLR
jgi:hypothetical protein